MNYYANFEPIELNDYPIQRWGHSSYIYKENLFIYGGYKKLIKN